MKEILSEPKLRAYRYKDLRGFHTSVTVDGESVDADGEVLLNFNLASKEEISSALTDARNTSGLKREELFWVVPLTDEIRNDVTELYRSREMVSEYERMGAQQRLTGEESACLADEKSRRDRIHRGVRTKLLVSIEAGTTFFQAVQADASTLGRTFPEALHALLDRAIPVLYPKLEVGVLSLGGDEPERFLTATNLNGLSKVFYHDTPERSLVVQQSGRYVPNLGSDLCRELLEYLRREHTYGNRVTGKMLEAHFSGLGYGWERESIRLGMAVLFRGGAVEVTHQGRKYRNYTEPASRPPFVNNPAFRAASFSPREALDLKVLANAARIYEEITGKDVNIEEGEITQAFKQVVGADREKLLPLAAKLSALRVPGAEAVQEQLRWAEGILEMPADDCVKTLAGEGRVYLEGRKRVALLERAATADNLQAIERARRILAEQWFVLSARETDAGLTEAAKNLERLLQSDSALNEIEDIRLHSEVIGEAYRRLYTSLFEKRKNAYSEAREQIKGRPEWLAIDQDPKITPEQRELLLQPLSQRADATLELPPGATVCSRTGATLPQLESDLVAVEAISRDVLRRVLELATPDQRIERVTVAKLFPGRITSEDELDEFLKDLRDRLSKILAQGDTIILE